MFKCSSYERLHCEKVSLVVKCCFLYVPTLTELSRQTLNECIYSQNPTEAGRWGRLERDPWACVCTMLCCSPSLQPVDTYVYVCRIRIMCLCYSTNWFQLFQTQDKGTFQTKIKHDSQDDQKTGPTEQLVNYQLKWRVEKWGSVWTSALHVCIDWSGQRSCYQVKR